MGEGLKSVQRDLQGLVHESLEVNMQVEQAFTNPNDVSFYCKRKYIAIEL